MDCDDGVSTLQMVHATKVECLIDLTSFKKLLEDVEKLCILKAHKPFCIS